VERKRKVKCSEIFSGSHLFLQLEFVPNFVEIVSIIWGRFPKKASLHIISMKTSDYMKVEYRRLFHSGIETINCSFE
jgi:hypothetical protein